tara:strand:+ start:182 stop:331 length:150 start_codon:yes stop_codon:yes gene_type:complete
MLSLISSLVKGGTTIIGSLIDGDWIKLTSVNWDDVDSTNWQDWDSTSDT